MLTLRVKTPRHRE